MSRPALTRAHLVVSTLLLIMVAGRLTVTVAVEVFGGDSDVLALRGRILGLLVLLAGFIAGAVISGRKLAGRSPSPLLRRKLIRTQGVGAAAAVGFLPCAIVLNGLAADGNFGATYAVVLAVELITLTVMLGLLGLNFRDGLALRGDRRARSSRSG